MQTADFLLYYKHLVSGRDSPNHVGAAFMAARKRGQAPPLRATGQLRAGVGTRPYRAPNALWA